MGLLLRTTLDILSSNIRELVPNPISLCTDTVTLLYLYENRVYQNQRCSACVCHALCHCVYGTSVLDL